jgi:hypothetical protein
MDNNARVKIQVDDSRVKELRQSAAELYDKFAKNAREQAKDLRDVNRHISEQIRLLETRNQKANALRRQELEAEFKGGAISAREYKSNLKGLEANRAYYTAQVRGLREILESDMSPSKRARELYSEMASGALGSGGDISSNINEKIRQFERQSKIDQTQRAFQLRSRYDQGYLSREQYRSGLRSIQADRQGDALLIKLLREIADNTKNDAKNSAEELVRRLGITSKDDAAKWIARLEGKRTGGAGDIIRRQEAANILRQQFNVEMTRQGGGGMIGLLGNLRGGIKGALSALGPVGVGLALAGGLGWGAMKRYSSVTSGSRDLAAINGWDLSDLWNVSLERGEGGLSLGMSSEEFLSRRLAYQRATGRRYSAQATISNFAQQRALGIDNGLYDQMLSTGRFGRGGTSQGAISAIARITQRQFGNLALLPELLNTYQSAAQSVLSSRGDFNQNTIAGVIGGLSQSGIQGPQLNRVVSGLQNIGNNQNPLARGLAYRAAAMVNPNASTWDLGMMIENPLNNTQFLKQYLSQASGLSGGNEVSAKYLLKGLTGLSHADTEALYKAYISGDLEGGLDRIRTTGGGGYEGRARNLTSPDEKFNAYKQYGEDFLINVAKEIGQSIVSAMQTEIEAREDQVRKIDEVIEKADNVVTKAFMGVTRANLDNPYIFSK